MSNQVVSMVTTVFYGDNNVKSGGMVTTVFYGDNFKSGGTYGYLCVLRG